MQKLISRKSPNYAVFFDKDFELHRLAEEYLGGEIFDFEFHEAKEYAEHKLFDWIIPRYGDADGARREPSYLAQLIEEAVQAKRLTDYCEFKRRETKNQTAIV